MLVGGGDLVRGFLVTHGQYTLLKVIVSEVEGSFGISLDLLKTHFSVDLGG